jgi:hypothetical protein
VTIAAKKLDRAETEICLLDKFVREQTAIRENMAVLSARYDKASDKHQIFIAQVPDLSDLRDRISITVGVIVHLLRSSLDNTVFEGAQRNTLGNVLHPERLQFPIFDDADDYRTKATRQIAELSERDQQIIESFQPYHGIAGRPDSYSGPYVHQLSLLRQLSNSDKHRSVVNILVDPNHFEINQIGTPILAGWTKWTHQNPREYINAFRPAEMKVGEIIFEAKIEMEEVASSQAVGYAMSQIALDERRPAIPTLKRIHGYIRGLLAAMTDEKTP